MADASLARRYARALVELGQKNGNIDQLGADLARFEGLLDLGDAQLRKALENPGITIGQKRGVIDAVLAKTDYHPLVKNFIRLLIDKGRFGHVSLIAAAYRDMADGLAGRVRATVRSARELSPSSTGASAPASTPCRTRWSVASSPRTPEPISFDFHSRTPSPHIGRPAPRRAATEPEP
jgi:F0F1-type ATP synthase delta subunit